MNATWIISANASRARFFSQANAAAPLEEVNDMVNDGARLRMVESSESDKLGPTAGTKSMHNTGGAVPNKLYEPRQTPDERAAELFAAGVIDPAVFVTARLPLERYEDALVSFARGEGVKTLVVPA